ncbi:rod shape-determining protein MreC [Mycobacteroides abscessus subsp. massiliense]|nr:rod shape-determining protein MreC [Mycobacteroides abscessus subsp. massiliense]
MNTILIDKGSKAGIKNNMAVMTSEGLVGRVTKVNQFSSQVDLISTHTRAGKLSVNIHHGTKNIFGLIDGLADQLPSGLYIGEVTKVENDQYGLAKQVRVKTGADMTDLTHVYVAKRDVSTIPNEGSDN